MAIGFSLSNVNEVLIEPNDGAIFFELKNIRYKIIIDDINRANEIISIINTIINNKKKVVSKQKPLPDFYKKV